MCFTKYLPACLLPFTYLGNYSWIIANCLHTILISGVRQEQDIYVRLIDSVTKQVSVIFLNKRNCFIKEAPQDSFNFCLITYELGNSNFVHVDENGSLSKMHSEIWQPLLM